MKLLIGLGNPEEKFFKNRHNVGWMFLDSICQGSWKESFNALYQENIFNDEHAILLKPTTFMNSSGISAKEAADFFSIKNKDVIIIHDDLDLPFSKIRVKKSKNTGGHNGVKSVMTELNANKIVHLKFGIGRPPESMTPYDYVLSDFTESELDKLPNLFKQAKSILDCLDDYDAMVKVNKTRT